LFAGTDDTTPGEWEQNGYYFIKTEGQEANTLYTLPLSLVRALSVKENDDGEKLALIQYQYGRFWDDKWRPWLPAGVQGNSYYTETDVPYTCVVVTDVKRGAGSMKGGRPCYTQPFMLHADTVKKLAMEPLASFSLFLKANSNEGEYERRTAQALRHNGPVVDPDLPSLDHDDDIEAFGDDVSPSDGEERAIDSDKSSDSDLDSDEVEDSESTSEEEELGSTSRSNHAQQKPGPKAKRHEKGRTLRCRVRDQDTRRAALDPATRTQQDPDYRDFDGQAGPSQQKPKTRSRAGGQGGESGRKRQHMEKELSLGE
jgi:hypothetical protein